MPAANEQVFKCSWNAIRCQRSLGPRQGNHQSTVLKGQAGRGRSQETSDLSCHFQGTSALPPLIFPNPECFPWPSSPPSPAKLLAMEFLKGAPTLFRTSANVWPNQHAAETSTKQPAVLGMEIQLPPSCSPLFSMPKTDWHCSSALQVPSSLKTSFFPVHSSGCDLLPCSVLGCEPQ